MDFTSEIDLYSKNIINSKYHRKGHVYRKSKTIGNISFNGCKIPGQELNFSLLSVLTEIH